MRILPALAALIATAAPAAAEMKIGFDWGAIPLCTSGNPNTVGNPAFTLSGVPAGTDRLVFKMTDLDVRSYNHGGGTIKVKITGGGQIPAGVFKYKSPCPPNGSHRYEWSVVARQGNKVLAKAAAVKSYP